MGSPPIPDAPPPDVQDRQVVDAGFKPSPTGATLCGFGLPIFFFNVNLPSFKFPPFPFPPNFNVSLQLNCDLSNPIDAEVSFGGGRASTRDEEPFDQDK